MASGDVVFRVTADEAKSLRAFQKLIEKEKEAARAARNLGNESRRGGKKAEQALARGAKQALGFAGALTGIGSAIGGVMLIVNQLKREYQHLVSQQQRAAATQTTLVQAQNLARWNLPSLGMTNKQLDEIMERVSKKQEVPRLRAWQVAAPMLSSMAGLSPKQVEGVISETLKIQRSVGPTFDVGPLAGGAMSLLRGGGAKTAKQAFGFLRSFGSTSRVETPQKQAELLLKTVPAGEQFGWTAEQSAELTSALSVVGEDPEGDITKTGTIKFMERLTKAREERFALRAGKKRIVLKKRGLAALKELQGIVKTLTPDERDSLYANWKGGRGAFKPALMHALGDTPTWRKAYDETAVPQIAAPEDSGRVMDTFYKGVETGTGPLLQRITRIFDRGTETQEIKNVKGAIASALRVGMKKYLKATPGILLTEIQISQLATEIETKGGTMKDVPGLVEARIKQLRKIRKREGYGYKYKLVKGTKRGGDEELFINELPEGTIEGKTFWGKKGWRVPQQHGVPYSYIENPSYDPSQAQSFDELGKLLIDVKAAVLLMVGAIEKQHKGETAKRNVNAQVPYPP